MISFVGLCLLLLAGHFLRMKVKLLQKLYMPSCVIGGLVGLIIIQLFNYLGSHSDAGVITRISESINVWVEPWGKLPGFLINIVFACLFLGVKVPSFGQIWHRSGPQVVYGQIVAWGQYAVAIVLWIVVLKWFFPELPGMFAGVLPVGFEGGHGTAGGLAPVFEQYGWSAGKDFALSSATFGIIFAIIVGMILVNWAARKGYTVSRVDPASVEEDDTIGVIPVGQRPVAGKLTVNSDVVESFSLHIAIVGLACLIGYVIKVGLLEFESSIPALAKLALFQGFPLFPLCMIGGLIIQICEIKFDKHNLIDLGLTRRIQNSALDFLVVAAIATIRLDVVASGIVPLLILVAVGVGWNMFCLLVLARRILPDAWFERGIAEMGQSMGVTATGLLLLRVVDPDYETPAADAFACKQIVHEPIMGGGLWTGMAIPLLAIKGPVFVLGIVLSVLTVWLGIVIYCRLRLKR